MDDCRHCQDKNCHTLLKNAAPQRDAQRKAPGARPPAQAISALKRIEWELARNAHNFLELVIQSAPLAMALVNAQGLFTHVNPQFFQEYGYIAEEMLNRHYSILYADEREMLQVMADLQAQGEVLSREVFFRHRAGHEVPTRISIRKLWGEDGILLGSVALGRNISEEVSLRRQLERAQKLEAVTALSGGLAHNFNNLLMVIMGLNTLMLASIEPGHPFYEDLKEIESQLGAGRELTQKLLAFARDTKFEVQSLDLNQLVLVTADTFARTRRDISIVKKLTSNLPPVEADPSQIQQVLMNLLINAWQAMPEGGEIGLATRTLRVKTWDDPAFDPAPGPYACLSVRDEGMGMDQETLGHIFEPFFTTKAPGLGSGLGLPFAYRTLKSHGGAIKVESQPGQGSTFSIYLPVSSSKPKHYPKEESRLIPGQGTVLLVDDEPVLRRVTAKLLEKLGYQVIPAATGQQAVEIFKEKAREIDLALLDLIMPGLSGCQTLEALRGINPQVRVLLSSGYTEVEDQGLPPGTPFISKPYTLEVLSQKLAAALRG